MIGTARLVWRLDEDLAEVERRLDEMRGRHWRLREQGGDVLLCQDPDGISHVMIPPGLEPPDGRIPMGVWTTGV